MRRFHSYGPVDCEEHFCVERQDLIVRCAEQLIGRPGKGGHYFTIWAPRQTGKTWLMRQVKKEIEERYGDRFRIGTMSVQGVVLKDDDPDEAFLGKIPLLMWETFHQKIEAPSDWESFKRLFDRDEGMFDRPVILFIDEFDSLPSGVIDRLVTLFRDIYLKQESYLLHGLSLIGVRAVLGVASDRGSPFNIQRSLHIPNFTEEEVQDLFGQYQTESGQDIEPKVVAKVYESTRGQPGLVCWFGELLTETYNPEKKQIIDLDIWKNVYRRACFSEWNNTLLNLIKKAQGQYRSYVLELFAQSDLSFVIRADWCNYLYLNGIIASERIVDSSGTEREVCRFSSPFVQQNIYNALTDDLVGDRVPILPLDPLDELTDVFEGATLDVPALLGRYKDYLGRLKAKGIDPWKEQPRRADEHFTEAVGHFHLYHWLQNAVGRRCVISPEFPTGNGKVDLHLKCREKRGLIEVKSFVEAAQVKEARSQAARYAVQMNISEVSVALFVPVKDEEVLAKLSGEEVIEDVKVTVVAIGWVG